jgi:hypothetical protein
VQTYDESAAPPDSVSASDVRADLRDARDLCPVQSTGGIDVRAAAGKRNVWLIFTLGKADALALRVGPNVGEIHSIGQSTNSDGSLVFEFLTPLGAARAKVVSPIAGKPAVRCTTSLIPSADTTITYWPRDLYALNSSSGVLHTFQRGLRTGIVFGTTDSPVPFTFFYMQNFSALTEYFSASKRSPADTVAGSWPEFGYAPPAGPDCVLPKAREIVVSDAYLSLSLGACDRAHAAGRYLDMLAEIYLALDRPPVAYHDWPSRADATLAGLTLSSVCTYERAGRRYLMPYVADDTKPPESMVQFTLAVNLAEYDAWRGEKSALSKALAATASSFYHEGLRSLVRWLPDEQFAPSQSEDNMNHTTMDSWYLCHALFNVFRIGQEGDAKAMAVFENSLPYLIRVARRFDYRWPIFFNLETLDVIRAEAEPGRGGEKDVAGLYALVMIHAFETLGNNEYLQEAEGALARLHGLGFDLAYQLNTTGFAAEAAMRLWKRTQKREYLELSELCMANIFDNMWLWQCDYGNALHYRTFFGLFPLRDAPYLAAFEELEAHAKFQEYLALGGPDVRPSLRLLIAEFQKYSLDRAWYYYPDALPLDVVSGSPRNGRIERWLSVPLEDLQDGQEISGQVGQELYGAGLAFVLTSRHYAKLRDSVIAYCNYPMYGLSMTKGGVARWRAGGDPRGSGELRIIPSGLHAGATTVCVWTRNGKVRRSVRGRMSPEGHALFTVRGGQSIEIECRPAKGSAGSRGVTIGALAAHRDA